MQQEKILTSKEIIVIGSMLFALFLGAGNMIFPPMLGQEAGTNIWLALAGFLVTGVGLPLLAVVAIARSGGDLQTLATRVHPIYGVVFTIIVYLAIGPLFGIPRTGTVAYEIGITPFIPDDLAEKRMPLFIFTILYFGITIWLSLNPSKLVDRIGKILTPALLIVLILLVSKSIITPMGTLQKPNDDYATTPFFKGFIEGYLTMDTLGALVFGIIVVRFIRGKGITNKKSITKIGLAASVIAAFGLGLVYLSLAFIGATSTEAIGIKDHGGAILAEAATYLYGSSGIAILSLIIIFACITTSVGLVSASATYFSSLLPAVSYPVLVIILSAFSFIFSNFGLERLIGYSLPVLIIIYPLAIVLIILSFADHLFHGHRSVYVGALIFTGLISIIDGFNAANITSEALLSLLDKLNSVVSFLPFYDEGVGWLLPAIVGALLGYIVAYLLSLYKGEKS